MKVSNYVSMAWIHYRKRIILCMIVGCICLLNIYQVVLPQILRMPEKITRTVDFNKMVKFDGVVKATQDERKATLRTACQRLYSKNPYAEENTYIHQRTFFSRTYKLVSCDILKCGYSSWLAAMFVMDDRYTVDDYLNNKVGGSKAIILGDKELRLWSIKNKDVQKRIWQESLRVITVRNPFNRLVSAYYNKMLTTSPGYTYIFRPMSQRINKQFRHLRHNVTERNQIGDGTATFEDFVNYLVTANNFKADAHWAPFVGTCLPCDAQYNYIIKFDTLNDDMEYLKQKLNISEYHRKAVFPPGNYKTNNDLVEKTFKTIPKALAQKLYEKYRNDFVLFGYEMPSRLWLT